MVDDTLAEKFTDASESIEAAEETLGAISEEISAALEEALADTPVDVTYGLDEGKVVADIPVEEIAAGLNRRLEPPFFARASGSRIVIGDVRRPRGLTRDAIEGFETEHSRSESVKTAIEAVGGAGGQGAPRESVLSALDRLGLAADEASEEIERLLREGEVYEPAAEHYRVAGSEP